MRVVLVPTVAAGTIGMAYALGGPELSILAILAFVVQWLAFPVAFYLRTDRFFDLVGSLTFLLLLGTALVGTEAVSLRGGLLAACVAVWALRLGLFLARRVHLAGRDRRFDAIKISFERFALAWTLQGLWVFLTPLPVWLVILRPDHGLGLLDGLGMAVWAFGFGVEAMADHQKWRFRMTPGNVDRYVSTGLWALSRHPNYFGEIVLWCGVFVSASAQLYGSEWLALASPVFVAGLLVAGSGVPLLEARADALWGHKEDYVEYRANTPVLIPSVSKTVRHILTHLGRSRSPIP